MADDGYVTILRTIDTAQGELIAEMFRREGIAARFHQIRSTLIGMPELMVEMSVDVPIASEARARELLRDLEYVGAADAAEHPGALAGSMELEAPDGDGADAAPPPATEEGPMRSRRHPLFAAGFAVFLPGGGHLYARRPWTGLVMAAGLVAGFALLLTSRQRALSEAAGGWLLALVACDAIAGVLAARAEARGQHLTRGAQLGRGLVLAALAVVLGVGGRVATQAPGMMREAQVAKFKVTCTGAAIVIENGGAEARELDVWNIRVATHSPLGNQTYDIGPAHAQRLALAPGARGTVSPDMAEWLARSCQLAEAPPKTDADRDWKIADLDLPAPTPLYCGFLFSFAARPPGSDGNQFEGFGRCIPATPTNAGTSGALELTR